MGFGADWDGEVFSRDDFGFNLVNRFAEGEAAERTRFAGGCFRIAIRERTFNLFVDVTVQLKLSDHGNRLPHSDTRLHLSPTCIIPS